MTVDNSDKGGAAYINLLSFKGGGGRGAAHINHVIISHIDLLNSFATGNTSVCG